MANSSLVVPLNIGMNTVVPPLLAEEGTLIDCMNYEMTDVMGYRRWDGYEAYDGFPNGNLSRYYRISLTEVVGGDQALIVPGSVLTRRDTGGEAVPVAVVVGGPFDTIGYDIVLFGDTNDLILIEEFLLQVDGVSFITLASEEGLLKITGDGGGLGSIFEITTPSSVTFEVTVSGTPSDGSELVEASVYLGNLRAYSAVLRALVQTASSDIVGLYWLEDRLYGAFNVLELTIDIGEIVDFESREGRFVGWNGDVYLILDVIDTGGFVYTVSMMPNGASMVVTDDDLVYTNSVGDSGGSVILSDVSVNGNPVSTNSTYAYIGYFNNPNTSITRGITPLYPAFDIEFENGSWPSAGGPPITIQDNDHVENTYYIRSFTPPPGGYRFRVRLSNIKTTSGDWTLGTAAGTAQVVYIETEHLGSFTDGEVIKPSALDTLAILADPGPGYTTVFDVSTDGVPSTLAGSKVLDANKTKYQWNTYNFYGTAAALSAYGTTGAGKAFWANANGWGTYSTGVEEEFDIPKYVSFWKNSLALGFARGSVILSEPGNPGGYDALLGAAEITTGDKITGLLELPGDTLAIFGHRTIRKLTGDPPVLGTISGSSGAFDYTAVLVGQQAIFTGINGITTLEQTAAYGDFAGSRLTDSISNYIRPRLVRELGKTELGGVAFAYPVRSKNQYRLFLSTGEVIGVTLTSDGPKTWLGNYALIGETKIPYAWSSEISDEGREYIHVVWSDDDFRTTAIQLESGWGFNGRTFRHYFDTAHLFFNNGTTSGSIEQIRLYGQGYGVATLDVKASGVEDTFEQTYHNSIQDISIPRNLEALFDTMRPVTAKVDHANWGLGVKLQFIGTTEEGSNATEPPHTCQALVLSVHSEGAQD